MNPSNISYGKLKKKHTHTHLRIGVIFILLTVLVISKMNCLMIVYYCTKP